jgi:hypothetical protein
MFSDMNGDSTDQERRRAQARRRAEMTGGDGG